MSRFLGPIHHWLYNKIVLHEELEKELVERFKGQYGDEVDLIVNENREKFGELLPNKPLEDLIDTDNIRGWLQSKITVVETRQAAILGHLFKKYKANGVILANSVYEENGIKCGKDAKEKYAPKTAEDLYKVLNNYILDGMPCDQVKKITEINPDYLEYKQNQCLHIGFWNNANVDSQKMYDLRRIWTEGFVNSANEEFKYQVSVEDVEGIEGFCHKIYKK